MIMETLHNPALPGLIIFVLIAAMVFIAAINNK